MGSTLSQAQLFSAPPRREDTVFVSERVTLCTQDGVRVVSVGGLIFQHYAVSDRMAEAHAMVLLVELGYADQNDVARAFGYSARTVRRNQARYDEGGLVALGRARGRPHETHPPGRPGGFRDRAILRMKAEELSNREIGHKLGIHERAVRKRLRRLGFKPGLQQGALFGDQAPALSNPVKTSRSDAEAESPSAHRRTAPEGGPLQGGLAQDPLDRTPDRIFAALGLLDDAVPMFAHSPSVPRAGALLAIPAIIESGVLEVAHEVYGNIGPAFYGLRTTIVAFILLSLMRIKRPEAVKEYAPSDLGRVLGLDRAPEVKTIRRKLARLAKIDQAERFGLELAQRRVAAHGRMMGFLYVDGHVRVYHGKHAIPKAHVTQMRMAAPATTDYWVNDRKGDPLFVVTAEANAWMTKMLPVILKEVRTLFGARRRITIVFDRAGYSPKLFAKLVAEGFDILTYRKYRTRKVAEKRFVLRKAILQGRKVEYRLHDQPVRFLKGKLRLRQVTRLTGNGHQTPILTSRFDLRDIEVAYRMFERWRQENFFKYLQAEYAIDALSDYEVEPDDPTRSVPNPAWRAADRELRAARTALAKLEGTYGAVALDNREGHRPTMRGFKIAHGKQGKQIRDARALVAKLKSKRAATDKRVPVAEALGDQPIVKLSTERKHLTNVLKLVAYQVESELLGLLRPHYARCEDEGRTLVQTVLQSSAAIEPTKDELRVTLAPLSSPHRSRVLAALCEVLNKKNVVFPGTELRMTYSVAETPP